MAETRRPRISGTGTAPVGADLSSYTVAELLNAIDPGVRCLYADIIEGLPVTEKDCGDLEFADSRLTALCNEIRKILKLQPTG